MEWSVLKNSNSVVSRIMSFHLEHLEIWRLVMGFGPDMHYNKLDWGSSNNYEPLLSDPVIFPQIVIVETFLHSLKETALLCPEF